MRVSIPKTQLLEISAAMAIIKASPAKVMRRAYSRTMTGARTDETREIGKVAALKASTIRSHISIHRQGIGGVVKNAGDKLSLIHYQARSTTRGITFRIYKSGARVRLRHAFIGTLRGGIKHVVERVPEEGRPKKPFRPGFKYAGMPREYRLPIRKLTGPSVPSHLENSRVWPAVKTAVQDRLERETRYSLNFELSKI